MFNIYNINVKLKTTINFIEFEFNILLRIEI